MEEKKEVGNVERLRKSSKILNLSTQQQRMNLREINDLTADFLKCVTNGWNDNERELLKVIINYIKRYYIYKKIEKSNPNYSRA